MTRVTITCWCGQHKVTWCCTDFFSCLWPAFALIVIIISSYHIYRSLSELFKTFHSEVGLSGLLAAVETDPQEFSFASFPAASLVNCLSAALGRRQPSQNSAPAAMQQPACGSARPSTGFPGCFRHVNKMKTNGNHHPFYCKCMQSYKKQKEEKPTHPNAVAREVLL